MPTLQMQPASLTVFHWHKATATLTTEASMLGSMKQGLWWLQRVWDDACDIGVAIESHVTHKIEKFYLEQEHTNDGDITHWTFKPVDKKCKVQKVVIFND